jgi:hypothetical protein
MNIQLRFRRALLGAGLALAALAPAALSSPAQAADPLTLSPLQIRVGGTLAAVSFTSSEPVKVTVNYRPAAIAATAAASTPQPITTGIISFNDPRFTMPGYSTTHEHRLTGLTSNTPYTVIVTARTSDNRTATAQGNFTTAAKRIRITLESINIEDDGDGILTGDGEPMWFVDLGWSGRPDPLGFSYNPERKLGEGRFTPRTRSGRALVFAFAEENFDQFPETVSLAVEADENDTVIDSVVRAYECITSVVEGGCVTGEESPTVWRVPQGVESASQVLNVRGDEPATGFESVLTYRMEVVHHNVPYPSTKRNFPYQTWR